MLKPYLRLFGFLLCLALLIAFANTHLLQTDTVAFLTLHEMKNRSDIQLAIVGSSVVRDHFDPVLITERTGLTAYSAAVPCAALPADIAMTEEMMRTSSPKWVVAVMEPYNFNTTKEELEAQYKLAPMLTSPKTALSYYMRLCREDGEYVNRLMLFRTQMAPSLKEIKKTFGLKYDTEATFEALKDTFDPGVTYMGAGFLRYDVEPAAQELIRRKLIRREPTRWEYSLMDAAREQLLDYKALCEENGAQLLLILYPMHTAQALANPDYLMYNESVMAFCSENGIPCFDFGYAKPSFMPRLDAYYFDLDHMNAEGARLLSEAFCTFFNRYSAGEDVSELFYPDRYAYISTLDFVTNCWLTPDGAGGFAADCNRASWVEAEYRFALLEADGSERLLADYGAGDSIEAEIAPGCQLRVYARPAGGTQDPQVYYDYPADYDAGGRGEI